MKLSEALIRINESDKAEEISNKETAGIVRQVLKEMYPNTKFKVTTKGASAIDVEWEDGPCTKELQYVLFVFQGTTSAINLKNYEIDTSHKTIKGDDGKVYSFGSDYVMMYRSKGSRWKDWEKSVEDEASKGTFKNDKDKSDFIKKKKELGWGFVSFDKPRPSKTFKKYTKSAFPKIDSKDEKQIKRL